MNDLVAVAGKAELTIQIRATGVSLQLSRCSGQAAKQDISPAKPRARYTKTGVVLPVVLKCSLGRGCADRRGRSTSKPCHTEPAYSGLPGTIWNRIGLRDYVERCSRIRHHHVGGVNPTLNTPARLMSAHTRPT